MDPYLVVGLLVLLIIVYFSFLKKKGVSADPNNPEEVLGEVDIYLAYGRTKKAKKLLSEALSLNPNHDGLNKKSKEIA